MHGILFLRGFEVAFSLIPSKKIFYQCLSPCSFLLHVICMCYVFCVCVLFLKEFAAIIIPYYGL